MEKVFTTTLFITIAIGLVVFYSPADACICGIKHPQQKFCESDFVFTATVRGSEHVDNLIIYDMKVSLEKVFKGHELIERGQKYIQVFTAYDGSLCGRPNLVYLEKYLISGSVVDGRLQITYCDWVTEWDQLSEDQIRYLKSGTYADQCDSCTVDVVYSAHSRDLNSNMNTFHESQLSGKWSRYQCTYNPIASAMYIKKDCEDLHAYCTRDIFSGECMWKSNQNYDSCFEIREATWSFKSPKRPAYTQVSQCRSLPNRRLKKKCVRAVRKYFRTIQDSAENEIPI